MRKVLVVMTACWALPAAAFAAEPPTRPEKCCCEKMMKEDGKSCCADKDKAAGDPHAGHTMDAPKS